MVDLWRDFWIRETGTGQQVAQLHDRYVLMKFDEMKLSLADSSSSYFRYYDKKQMYRLSNMYVLYDGLQFGVLCYYLKHNGDESP